MAERRYFGTDGIRGVAGEDPVSGAFAFRLGIAAAEGLRRKGSDRPHVVIGMDTRRSGPMLAHAVAAGLTSRGADVTWLGVMPTPGVSYLARVLGADAGVVISASHNPFFDNGLKLFNDGGAKLSDTLEAEIEALLEIDATGLEPVTGSSVGSAVRYRADDGLYQQHLLDNAPYLDGLRVGLDCANGASHQIAPRVFEKIGARLDVIHAQPDGENINVACGSTHPETIQRRVLDHDLDVGITFDGDADRALLVDRRGRLVTGDHILAICALTSGEEAVVGTVMSNLGVERYLRERGVEMHRVQVGDRYVHGELERRDLRLGGEQSGHVLFLDKSPTGDGILTSLQALAAVRKSGRSLEAWMDEIPVYPQRLVNVAVPGDAKTVVLEAPAVQAAVEEAQSCLGDLGRVHLRASGTEPLIRVMVEAEDGELVDRLADQVASAVEAALD